MVMISTFSFSLSYEIARGDEVGWFYPSADISAEGAANRHNGQLVRCWEFGANTY